MFTLLEKIAGLLLNFTKRYLEHQDRKIRKDFGESILTCYLRLLEVIFTGKRILDQIENYLGEYYEDPLRFSNDELGIRAYYWNNLLRKQTINLSRLAEAMHAVRHKLCILAPEVADLLPVTSSGKRKRVNELFGLTHILASGKFPTNPLSKNSGNEKTGITLIGDEESHRILLEYLVIDAPRDNLDKLEKCANQIRELIVQHLKIEEILWSIDRFHDYD